MIKYCGCTGLLGNNAAAKFQDSKYGIGNRVANYASLKYRCTVCNKDIGSVEKKK